MTKDTIKTAVIFRMWPDGGCLALMPYLREGGNCMSYQNIGQHSAADYAGCVRSTRPATPVEYAPLSAELASIGYNVRIIKRINPAALRRARAEYEKNSPACYPRGY